MKRPRSDEPPELAGLLAWLRAAGASFDHLRFGPSPLGGTGVFATRELPAGSTLVSIPQRCVLTARVAHESKLGRAMRRAAREWHVEERFCSDEALLWIFMCAGRKDPSHEFHPYLASLPTASPDPACWSEKLRAEVRGTPLGPAIAAAREFAAALFDAFAARVAAALLPAGCLESADDLLWARGMCLSRAFPASLVAPTGIAASDCPGGCLLPLFDLLNHAPSQPISYLGSKSSVALRTDVALAARAEVHNNYGERSNEQLLLSYGFCLRDVSFHHHANPRGRLWLRSRRWRERSNGRGRCCGRTYAWRPRPTCGRARTTPSPFRSSRRLRSRRVRLRCVRHTPCAGRRQEGSRRRKF